MTFAPDRVKAAITHTTQDRLDLVVNNVIWQAISVAACAFAKFHEQGMGLTGLNVNGPTSLMKMLFDHYHGLCKNPGTFHFSQNNVNYSFRSEIVDFINRQGKRGQCPVTFMFTFPTNLQSLEAELAAIGEYTECEYVCLYEAQVDEFTVARMLVPKAVVHDLSLVDIAGTI
jgi:hypothetical protein